MPLVDELQGFALLRPEPWTPIDASVSNFAEDAVYELVGLPTGTETYTGRDEIRTWMEGLMKDDFRLHVDVIESDDSTVRTETYTWVNWSREADIAPLVENEEYIVPKPTPVYTFSRLAQNTIMNGFRSIPGASVRIHPTLANGLVVRFYTLARLNRVGRFFTLLYPLRIKQLLAHSCQPHQEQTYCQQAPQVVAAVPHSGAGRHPRQCTAEEAPTSFRAPGHIQPAG